MAANVVGDAAVGAQRGGEHEADSALLDDVGGAVMKAGFGAGPGDQGHAEGGAIVVGGLASVANVELKVICTVDGEEALFSVDFWM